MSAELQIEVDNLDQVLRDYSSLRVYRSELRDGAYVEVTTPESRLGLLPGVNSYTFEDPAGSSASWYTLTYYSETSRQQSSQSSPVQATSSDPLDALLDVEELKQNYLYGLKLTDLAGKPLPDSIFRKGIRAAVTRIQRRLGLQLAPVEIKDEAHDVRLSTAAVIPLANLRKIPVRKVRALRMNFAWSQQSSPTLLNPENLDVHPFEGRIELRSTPGGPFGAPRSYRNGPGYFQAQTAMRGTFRGAGALKVDYAAGFAPGELPADIADLLAKAACLHPLAVAGDLAGPIGIGSSSISFDGLGQSIGRIANQQGNAYASRMNDYMKQIEDEIGRLRSTYRGLQLRVV